MDKISNGVIICDGLQRIKLNYNKELMFKNMIEGLDNFDKENLDYNLFIQLKNLRPFWNILYFMNDVLIMRKIIEDEKAFDNLLKYNHIIKDLVELVEE